MPLRKYYIIDFDSTLIQTEALDELAAIALAKHPRKSQLLSQIKRLTNFGMSGKITIEESLAKRLKLLQAKRQHVTKLVGLLKGRITPSFLRQRSFLKRHASSIYIISGGFREYIAPVIAELGLLEKNLLCNTFIFDRSGKIVGLDPESPLAYAGGKARAVAALQLKGDVCVLGDGYTDYEIKKAGLAKEFVAFCENVRRPSVIKKADRVVESLDEFLS